MWRLLLCLTGVFAKITVYEPKYLKEEFESRVHGGVIKSSIANFGNTPYGSVILGKVIVPKGTGAVLGCEPFELFGEDEKFDPEARAIVLLERGVCFFVTKVKNAEFAGASAVILINNDDTDPETIVLTDNGQAGDIYIPSALISKFDGEMLRQAIEEGHDVYLTMSFDIEKKKKRAEVSLWISSSNTIPLFFTQMKEEGVELSKDIVEFTPHYVLWQCYGCTFNKAEDNCISGGRYCAPDPDDRGPLTGRDILLEDLRQICIYKKYTKGDTYSTWTDYIINYSQECSGSHISQQCSEMIMERVGIVPSEIEACVQDSVQGGNILVDDNALLKAEYDLLEEKKIAYFPALIINGQYYRGDFEFEPVAMAVCDSLKHPPKICSKLNDDDSEKDDDDDEDIVSTLTIVIILVICALLVTALMIFYKAWVKNELRNDMRQRVDSAVAQYFSFNEGQELIERPTIKASYVQ